MAARAGLWVFGTVPRCCGLPVGLGAVRVKSFNQVTQRGLDSQVPRAYHQRQEQLGMNVSPFRAETGNPGLISENQTNEIVNNSPDL